MRSLCVRTALLIGLAAGGERPALAQQASPASEVEDLARLRILPEDECRAGAADAEIVVCARRRNDERYRLPIRPEGFDPHGTTQSVSRERHSLYEMGEAGIGSCSTVGPGGWTGCMLQTFRVAEQQEGR